ncbi:transposase [Bartonella sp. M0280]|nr:transposase [Bartonella apihabitans]
MLCRKHGFSEGSYYHWYYNFGGMDVYNAKRPSALESRKSRLTAWRMCCLHIS